MHSAAPRCQHGQHPKVVSVPSAFPALLTSLTGLPSTLSPVQPRLALLPPHEAANSRTDDRERRSRGGAFPAGRCCRRGAPIHLHIEPFRPVAPGGSDVSTTAGVNARLTNRAARRERRRTRARSHLARTARRSAGCYRNGVRRPRGVRAGSWAGGAVGAFCWPASGAAPLSRCEGVGCAWSEVAEVGSELA